MEAIESFKRFALSVDIVNENLKNEIKAILTNISENVLGASFFEIQEIGKPDVRGNINNLRTIWSNGPEFDSQIKNNDGTYTGQTTFAFDKKYKLWITDLKGKKLSKESACINHWGTIENKEELPSYWEFAQDNLGMEVKTSVILPLIYEGVNQPIGIMNFEFEEYLECTNENKKVFEKIMESVTILLHLFRIRKNQIKNSQKAVNELRDITKKKVDILKKPRVFIAFPMRNSTDVMDLVRKIAGDNNERFEFIFWDDINDTGNIDTQLMKEILASRYSIVYFSELKDDGTYMDNPNVLFEAGMFHALSNQNITEEPKAWIPIREKASPKKPFDFARERIITVPRQNDNSLNKQKLKMDIETRLRYFE